MYIYCCIIRNLVMVGRHVNTNTQRARLNPIIVRNAIFFKGGDGLEL